jgi:hypothetical protein
MDDTAVDTIYSHRKRNFRPKLKDVSPDVE